MPSAARPWMDRVLVTAILTSVLVTWEILGRILRLRTDLLPTPSRILLEIWKEGFRLYQHATVTAQESATGFLFAALLAIPLGFLMASFGGLYRALMPVVRLSYIIPVIAAAPLLLAWFGFGTTSKVLMAALVSFFPVVIQTATGLRSLPEGLFDLTRAMGARPTQQFFKLKVPASLPHIFKGLKMAVPLSVAGVAVAEFSGADGGLGYLLVVASSNLNTALLFAALAILALVVTVLFYSITTLERLLIGDLRLSLND